MNALQEMLLALDDVALSAFSSPGVLRQAKARLNKPDVIRVIEQTEESCQLIVEDWAVTVTKDGLSTAICNCPATGICRHQVAAVLYLRDRQQNQVSTESVSTREQIKALTVDEIRKFAGADWPHTVRIAALAGDITPTDDKSSCVISLPDAPSPVTFVLNGGLRGAVYKGPSGRRKRFVAAAALIIINAQIEPDEFTGSTVSEDLLEDASRVVLSALHHGLKGDPMIAQDLLFDIAVSARADSAPRLASMLRLLSRMAGELGRREPQSDPVIYLEKLSECYALIRALQKSPGDMNLAGQLRREYKPERSSDIAFLGANKWQSKSGARGLTIIGWDGVRFLSTGPARANSADFTFSPQEAYHLPWWEGITPSALVGSVYRFEAPSLSSDSIISSDSSPDQKLGPIDLNNLPFISNWIELKQYLMKSTIIGLRNGTKPIPALIKFAATDLPEFDEIRQLDTITLFDVDKRELLLELPNEKCGKILHNLQGKLVGALVMFMQSDAGYTGKLISLYRNNPLQIWNVTLEQARSEFQRTSKFDKASAKIQSLKRCKQKVSNPNNVCLFIDQAMQTLCDGASFAVNHARLKKLVNKAQVLGLVRCASKLENLRFEQHTDILNLCWELMLIKRVTLLETNL